MPRKDLSLADKIALLDKIKNLPPNLTVRELEKSLGVSKSVVGRLKKCEVQHRKQWSESQKNVNGNSTPTDRKRKRKGKDPDIDEAMNEWFSTVTARGVRVTGPMIMAKAETLAQKINHVDFKPSNGWLSRWKARCDIKFKRSHGEKASADKEGAEEWSFSTLPDLLKEFSPDNIYNADETGLFYRATPDGSLCYKQQQLEGSKKAMDRITVLCCCNMSGTDKRKLLVIGKSANPRCFKRNKINVSNLPVTYLSNKKAWITSEIFTSWINEFNSELRRKNRKILLLVDNAGPHPHLLNLTNIRLEFLPPNTTSILQPLDMGIIKNLKTFYRSIMMSYVLNAIEENLISTTTKATEISSKIDILQAIQFIADSWRKVTSSTIQNCFAHSGFKTDSSPVGSLAANETENDPGLQRIRNAEQFLSMDDNLECHDDIEDFEDVVLEEIAAKKLCLNDSESDDDGDDSEAPHVTTKEAIKCLDRLRIFFMQDGHEEAPNEKLNACFDFVSMLNVKEMKQKSITDYFC